MGCPFALRLASRLTILLSTETPSREVRGRNLMRWTRAGSAPQGRIPVLNKNRCRKELGFLANSRASQLSRPRTRIAPMPIA